MTKYIAEKKFFSSLSSEIFKIFNEADLNVINHKDKFDLVTNVDMLLEKNIIYQIKSIFPDDEILSEESYSDNLIKNKRLWIIDPLDGTCNFANEIPLYGVQIALLDKGKRACSMLINAINSDVCCGFIDEGVFVNGFKIRKNKCRQNFEDAIVSFGDYTHKSINYANLQHNAIGAIMNRVMKIRMFGSSCLDFLFVAVNKTHACVVMTNNVWDLIPGMILCESIGMVVSNLKGEEYTIGDYGVVAACSQDLHKLLIQALN